jgi:hypothetical protein
LHIIMNRYLVLLVALSPLTAFTQQQPQLQPTPTPTPLTPPVTAAAPSSQPVAVNLTAEDLGPFLDGLMNAELAWHDIAGGIVTVVKD